MLSEPSQQNLSPKLVGTLTLGARSPETSRSDATGVRLIRCGSCDSLKSIEEFPESRVAPLTWASQCYLCEQAMHAANNPKVNAISSIAYALVGGESAFYALEADRRQVNRDIARRLYEAGLTVGSAEANNKRVVEGFVYIVTNPAFPGWIKIGCAMNMPSRIEAFNTVTHSGRTALSTRSTTHTVSVQSGSSSPGCNTTVARASGSTARLATPRQHCKRLRRLPPSGHQARRRDNHHEAQDAQV